jgi:hypothetical protein
VYDRGVLICNGCYGLGEEDSERLQRLEGLLDLNIAACMLKARRARARARARRWRGEGAR